MLRDTLEEYQENMKKIKREKGTIKLLTPEMNLTRVKAMNLRMTNDILERVNDVRMKS